jgi:hypothetical protein
MNYHRYYIRAEMMDCIHYDTINIAQRWTKLTNRFNYKLDPIWMKKIMGRRSKKYYQWAISHGYINFVEDMEPINHKKQLGDWYIPYMAHKAIHGIDVDYELILIRNTRLAEIISLIPKLYPVRIIFLRLLIGNESDPLPKIENN